MNLNQALDILKVPVELSHAEILLICLALDSYKADRALSVRGAALHSKFTKLAEACTKFRMSMPK